MKKEIHLKNAFGEACQANKSTVPFDSVAMYSRLVFFVELARKDSSEAVLECAQIYINNDVAELHQHNMHTVR